MTPWEKIMNTICGDISQYEYLDDFSVNKNKELLDKYPFLMPRDNTDKVIDNFDYSYTLLDDMPFGWKKSFGEKMCEEITQLLNKVNFLDKYRVLQIKEKYGGLRWYDNTTPKDIYDDIRNIISKYEDISFHTCVHCGDKADGITTGWNIPVCNECNKKHTYGNLIEIDKYLGKE